jgi:hypothetical protein
MNKPGEIWRAESETNHGKYDQSNLFLMIKNNILIAAYENFRGCGITADAVA